MPIYHAYKNGQSFTTIPAKVAQSLNWKDGDKINVEFETMNGKRGLFLSKVEDSNSEQNNENENES